MKDDWGRDKIEHMEGSVVVESVFDRHIVEVAVEVVDIGTVEIVVDVAVVDTVVGMDIAAVDTVVGDKQGCHQEHTGPADIEDKEEAQVEEDN